MKRILYLVLMLSFIVTIADLGKTSVSAISDTKTVNSCTNYHNVLGMKIGEFCNKTRFYYDYDEVTSVAVYATGYRSLGSLINKVTDYYVVNDVDYQTSASGDLCLVNTSWWKGLDCWSAEKGILVRHDGTFVFN